jgi:hypothetical protein
MKKIYFLLLLSFFITKTNAQWVTIPDPNFATFLQQNYPACMNGNQMDTTCNAIVNATNINCSNQNISDLTGIQYFINLEQLICYNNNLSTLPPLPNSLFFIDCSLNNLVSLPNLPASLVTLWCYYNQLTTLPPLPNSLFNLSCQNNQLSTIPPLPPILNTLDCSNNMLASLPSLPNSLSQLYCQYNQLTSLPSLPNLQYLYCNNNQLTSLPPLPTSVPVFQLRCQNNQLTTIPTLPSSGWVYVWCYNNQIVNLPPLPNQLLDLRCNNNQLTTIPELPDTLFYLYVHDNPNLNCLPVLKGILNLDFTNTNITCIPNYGNVGWSNPPLNSLPLCSSIINAQITSSTTSLCGISSITLSADTGTGYSYQWQLNSNNISGATSQTYDATIAGDYTVIVIYNCALDTSNTITITSGAAPSAAISATDPVNFCSGGSVILDANTGTGLTYQWQLDGTNITGATSSSYTASNAGNYSVIVSNNCGNSISNIITVNVTSAPGSAGTIAGPTAFCRHTTQTFSVSPVTGATNYVWSVPPQATIVSGAGTNSIVLKFKVKQGDVTVKAANQCGSGPLSVLPVQVVKCFQANNAVMRLTLTSESEIALFPNPASSEVTIQFISAGENKFTFNLYDIHGRMVLAQNSIAVEGMNEFTFDVEFLSKGVYMIELTTVNERILKKLIVQ